MSVAASHLWLRASCIVVVLAGLVFAFGAVAPLSGLAAYLTDLTFWPPDGAQALAGEEARLLSGVLGAVMIGWGAMLFLIVERVYPDDPALVRTLVLISLSAWFVADCTASLFAGAPLNIGFNVVFVLLFAIPLLLARSRRPAD